MIDTSLYTFLASVVTSPFVVEEGKIDFDKAVPFVWFQSATPNKKPT